jgi:hypothetical protein
MFIVRRLINNRFTYAVQTLLEPSSGNTRISISGSCSLQNAVLPDKSFMFYLFNIPLHKNYIKDDVGYVMCNESVLDFFSI